MGKWLRKQEGQDKGGGNVDIQPRVLVIDADTAMLTSMASVAAEEGFDVRTAVDVDGAVRQCRSAYIDLVLIDARGDQRSAANALSSVRTRSSARRGGDRGDRGAGRSVGSPRCRRIRAISGRRLRWPQRSRHCTVSASFTST